MNILNTKIANILTNTILLKENTMPSSTINISMFGASGVGKSSLLAGMYHKMSLNDSCGVNLRCDNPNQKIFLDSKVRNLKGASSTLDNSGGIEGTNAAKEFRFNLSATPSNQSKLSINFRDIPGAWVNDETKRDTLHNYLNESQVVMLAIHTPALMDMKGKNNEKFNQVSAIQWFLKEQNFSKPILILLVPIKCESYIETEDKRRKLQEAILLSYKELIQDLQSKPNVAIAITPIETMGNMHFEGWNQDEDKYYRVNNNAYSPRHIEQPLFYALNFALNYYLTNQRSRWVRVLDKSLPFLNFDSNFKKAIVKLANHIKTREDGFLLLQGDHLLINQGI